MKTLILLTAVGLVGCVHSTRVSTAPSDQPSNRNYAGGATAGLTPRSSAIDSGDATGEIAPAAAASATTASATTASASANDAASTTAVSAADAASTASITYAAKETYPHSNSASTTALIGGGAGGGGEPIAPAESVVVARIAEWQLAPADIQSDVEQGKPIVRTKSIGAGEPTGRSDSDALHTLINNRLMADVDAVRVTTRQIEVNGSEVTLRGAAFNAELIGRAIAITLDTPGVTKVTSELQIDPNHPRPLREEAARAHP